MDNVLPHVTKVENAANILQLTFDNGAVRYLKSHYARDLVNSFQGKTGKGHHKLLMTTGTDVWLGSQATIKTDGTVVLNGNDVYTPDELWHDSKTSLE